MALVLIPNPPDVLGVNTDFTTFLTRENGSNLGVGIGITTFRLTFWDGSTTQPLIAEGSIVEVGGSLYQADVDTALVDEGGLSNGTVHIKLIPGAGSPDPLTVVPTLTNDALPAWDANKVGWYTGANKYLPYEMTKTAAVFTLKSEFIDQNKTVKIYSNGNIGNDITINNDLTVSNDLTVTGNIVGNTLNSGNVALKRKFISGTTGAGATLAITHGLTSSKIRGVSSSLIGRAITSHEVSASSITFGLGSGAAGITLNVVIDYVE